MKLTAEEKKQSCLYELERWGYDLCYKIAHTPNDVSYSWYSKLFEDFDWDNEEYKNIKGRMHI